MESEKTEALRAALLMLLDQVDYTQGACSPTEMVGAVLPASAIKVAHDAVKQSREP